MSDMYLITNFKGTFVFDEEFKVVDKIEYEAQDSSIWTKEEKKLIAKYENDNLFYVGHKQEKFKDVKISKDSKKLKNMAEYFVKDIKDFFEENLKLTKQKVKASVQDDSLIIQAIRNIEEINKVANMLSKRLREWYELYLPEFSKSIEDHEAFVRLILENDKDKLLKDIKLKKEETMGAELAAKDIKAIMNLAKEVTIMYKLREEQEKYLEAKMKKYCPNLLAIAGTTIGANLLSHAGDLRRLMLMPASTVQLLGAEKALFRHLRTGARPPKYGVLINHPIVASAQAKGKAARKLADKITIAIKIDYFKGEFIGDKLREQVEAQLK